MRLPTREAEVHAARSRGIADWESGCWRLAPERQCGQCDYCVSHRVVLEKGVRRRAPKRTEPEASLRPRANRRVSKRRTSSTTTEVAAAAAAAKAKAKAKGRTGVKKPAAAAGKGKGTLARGSGSARRPTPAKGKTTPTKKGKAAAAVGGSRKRIVAKCCKVCAWAPAWPLPDIPRGTKDKVKEIAWQEHLDCCWEMVRAAWVVLCDGAGIPDDDIGRRHCYFPGQIARIAEPEIWSDKVDELDPDCHLEGLMWTRKETAEAAKGFALLHIGYTLNGFEGYEHVVPRTSGCKKYSRSFANVVEVLATRLRNIETLNKTVQAAVAKVARRIVDDRFKL